MAQLPKHQVRLNLKNSAFVGLKNTALIAKQKLWRSNKFKTSQLLTYLKIKMNKI